MFSLTQSQMLCGKVFVQKDTLSRSFTVFVLLLELSVIRDNQFWNEQESCRAYCTAVSRVVIHLNKIHLNDSQILTITQCLNEKVPLPVKGLPIRSSL